MKTKSSTFCIINKNEVIKVIYVATHYECTSRHFFFSFLESHMRVTESRRFDRWRPSLILWKPIKSPRSSKQVNTLSYAWQIEVHYMHKLKHPKDLRTFWYFWSSVIFWLSFEFLVQKLHFERCQIVGKFLHSVFGATFYYFLAFEALFCYFRRVS